MPNTFSLDILTPDKTVYSGDISSLVVPAQGGYLGVLAHHAPLIAALLPGVIRMKDAGGVQTEIRTTGRGFLEVHKNKAVILLDEIAP